MRAVEFRPPDRERQRSYLLAYIPAGFWVSVKAKAKRQNVSIRVLILRLLKGWLDEPEPES